jgi:hypothetical protein
MDNPTTYENLSGTVEVITSGTTRNGDPYANLAIRASHLNYPVKIGVFNNPTNPDRVGQVLAMTAGQPITVSFKKRPMPDGTGHYRDLETIVAIGEEQPPQAPFNPVSTPPVQYQQATPAPTPAPRQIQSNPDQDRQTMIMLQNSSAWISHAYMEWLKLGDDRPPFQVILDDIAHYATGYTYEVYWNKGYTEPQPPEEEPVVEGDNAEDNPF